MVPGRCQLPHHLLARASSIDLLLDALVYPDLVMVREDDSQPNGATAATVGQQMLAGVRDVWPVALGMVPLGVAFGLLITQFGFAWWWAPIFSIVIYAGSMEFLAITLVTGGVGPLSAALYGLLINFRHVFYALNYPIRVFRNPVAAAYGMYALTDETYAVISAKRHARWTQARVLSVQILLQLGWVGGGILGALCGQALPIRIEGMEFALTALFAVLLIEAFAAYRDLSLLISAAACGVFGWFVFADNMLMAGMSCYFTLVLARFYSPKLDRAMRWHLGSGRSSATSSTPTDTSTPAPEATS